MSTEDFTAAVRSIEEGLDRRERTIASLKDELIERLNEINAKDRRIATLETQVEMLQAELVRANGLPI